MIERLIANFPVNIVSVATALIAVVLFALSPKLPSLFPPAAVRVLALWLIFTSTMLQWAAGNGWPVVALMGGGSFLLLLIIHLVQTVRKRPVAPVPDEPVNTEDN